MRLVILGGPGAGKGTQAQRLCPQLQIVWISTGDMLRQAIVDQTELGQTVQTYLDRGELVPDAAMVQLIRQRLLQPDVGQGWLLDGYPRTAFQAEELDFLLDELGQRMTEAIWLEVPNLVLVERSLARGRSDDQPDIVQRRIDIFHESAATLLDYYTHRHRLFKINGDQPIAQVEQDILASLSNKQ